MATLTNRGPIICVDFDGVCHNYQHLWTNIAVIEDAPTPGLAEWIREANKRARVALFSSRMSVPMGRTAILEWWQKHDLPPVEMWTRKPPALVSIDDRALTFTGDWGDFPIEGLLAFKPWNRK